MNIHSLLFALLVLVSHASLAASCVKTGSVCVDSTPCKKISGVDVCLNTPAVPASCWKYTDTYNCLDKSAVDYCAAIRSTPGCQQVNSVCATPSSSGCTRWTNTYRCDGSPATPVNTVKLDTSYTVTKDTTNKLACDSLSSNPTCQLASHVCTEPAETRSINGLPIYKDCWAWQDSYSCLGDVQSDCGDLAAKGCTFSSSTCLEPEGATGANCLLHEKTYSCPTAGGSTTVMDCSSQQYCTGGNCFNTGHEPDKDLASAVVAQEIGRQGATYIDGNQRLFGGVSESCKHNKLGRCCDPKGGAVKNSSIAGVAVRTVGGQVIKAGSAYMYDYMFSAANSVFAAQGAAATASAATGAAAGAYSASAFGVTATYTTTAGAAAATAGGTATSAGLTFAFDPTSLAVAVAIMVVIEVSSCEPEEKVLAKKNGAGLCRLYRSKCKKPFCASVTRSYCCFNSKLAKIINTAAVTQLGRANSDCSGLTVDEFGQLDFSKIDMSEFIAEITSAVTLPSTGPINTDANLSVQQKLQNYYDRGRQ